MSDQETAIQLIRNEAAELIVRAKAAGLSLLVFNAPQGTIVDIQPLPVSQSCAQRLTAHIFSAKEQI